jgi:integrase
MTTQRVYAREKVPVDDWPEKDRRAWSTATRPAGPLDDGGAAARLSPETREALEQLYGALLGWLAQGGELDPDGGPAERLTEERYPRYLAMRRQRVSENTIFNNLRMLSMMLKLLAPAQDWRWLYKHPLAPRRAEAEASRRAVPIVSSGQLLRGVLDELEALSRAPTDLTTAVRCRDLLMVGACLTTALRQKDLLDLTIGRSFFRYPGGHEIRRAAVKNGAPVTTRLMGEFDASLDRYVAELRPILLREGDDAGGALWVSALGGRLAAPSATEAFKRVTISLLGTASRAHAFRHMAVTTVLSADPNGLPTAAALLAHTDTDTAERFYDLSSHESARARWRAILGRYRRRGGGTPDDA